MNVWKVMPVPQGKKKAVNDPNDVICLDGDEDETDDVIEDEEEEEVSDNPEIVDTSEPVPDAPEVISLVDDDDDNDKEEEEEYSDSDSDESDYAPLGTAKITFLDPENIKVHKFIRITNAENETDYVNVEDVSSDSDVEEIVEKPDKKVYITIDPDDYEKVTKDVNTETEDHKSPKRKILPTPEKKKKLKDDMATESCENNNVEGLKELISSPSPSSNKSSEPHESSESSKAQNIPTALCCPSCGFVCFKKEELSFHISMKHPSKTEPLRIYSASEILELEREMKDQAGSCSSCGQAIWYLPTLRAHAMIHPSGYSGCEACHHGTTVVKALMDHLEAHVDSEEEDSDT